MATGGFERRRGCDSAMRGCSEGALGPCAGFVTEGTASTDRFWRVRCPASESRDGLGRDVDDACGWCGARTGWEAAGGVLLWGRVVRVETVGVAVDRGPAAPVPMLGFCVLVCFVLELRGALAALSVETWGSRSTCSAGDSTTSLGKCGFFSTSVGAAGGSFRAFFSRNFGSEFRGVSTMRSGSSSRATVGCLATTGRGDVARAAGRGPAAGLIAS